MVLGRRGARLTALLLAGIALFPAASSLRADDLTTAQQQLAQITSRRGAAEARLADARREVATLNLQLQSNANRVQTLQAQTATLQRQAGGREAVLNGDLAGLLADLQAARAQLAHQQQAFSQQQAAGQAQLDQEREQLRGAQEALRQADAQRLGLQRDAAALSGQLTAMDADLDARSRSMAVVLVQLYKLSQTSALNLVLGAGNVSDGLNRLTLLGTVSQHDQDLMRSLANERDLTRRQHEVLANDLAGTVQLQAELQAEREEISLRAGAEAQLVQQVQGQLAQAQVEFTQQAATLDAGIGATQGKILANRQQLAAARAPLDAQRAKLAVAQHSALTQLGQAQQQQAGAEAQIAAAERDQAAATRLIQQLQAAAAARAAAERAAEQARQAAQQRNLAAAAAAQRAAEQARATVAAAAPAASGGHFIWPLSGPITQGYGPTSWTMEPPGHGYAHWHTGIDIAAGYGSPIRAAASGVVIQAGWLGGGNWGYGNSIIIVHDGTYSTLYGHLSGVAVGVDQAVRQGQVIGYEGSTGNSTGPHLHFEVRVNGNPVNPSAYL